MSVSLLINFALSVCAYQMTKRLIPGLSAMFISANLFGIDMCKRDRPKTYVYISFGLIAFVWYDCFFSTQFHNVASSFRPESMGLVSGCIFLVALFVFIPMPFIFKVKPIVESSHNQVRRGYYKSISQWLCVAPYHFDVKIVKFSFANVENHDF